LYAAGEILLVMIGILLALQVNNWNESRKKNALVKELLGELVFNLEDDIEDMRINRSFHNRSISSANTLLEVFEMDLPEHDSLYAHFGNVLVMPQFLPTESAYYNLKDVGVRIVKDQALRDKLVEYYENHLVFAQKLADTEWDTALDDYNNLYREKFSSSEFTGSPKMIPESFEDIKRDIKFHNYLRNRIGILRTSAGNYSTNIERAQELIDMIEAELGYEVQGTSVLQ
jgi:hypothetical protein